MFNWLSNFLDSCKARTKFRGVLTKLKAKAVKLLALYNSKFHSEYGLMSMEDFQDGLFPWDLDLEDDTVNKSRISMGFPFVTLIKI
jgi:hypothetical protein